jgi:GNAT superfamily N-acetyltransferase
MPSLEIHPLSELRGEAAGLLAERYARQREAESLLPDVDDFEAEIPDAEGVVATRSGEAVAFLAGAVEGDRARAGFADHAASEPEALRDLFTAMAERWGVSRFEVAVPAADKALINVWFRLAFGCQFMWAVRETEAVDPVDFGGEIRPATPDDLEALARFDEILWALQQRAPSFTGVTTPPHDQLLEEWRGVWDEPEVYMPFIAERDGEPLGHVLLYRRPEGGLRVPAGNVDLADAATLFEIRGKGVGLALTAFALRWAHEHGFTSMTVDWRSVNLLSSRFWPRRGFRPQYLRLYRAVP